MDPIAAHLRPPGATVECVPATPDSSAFTRYADCRWIRSTVMARLLEHHRGAGRVLEWRHNTWCFSAVPKESIKLADRRKTVDGWLAMRSQVKIETDTTCRLTGTRTLMLSVPQRRMGFVLDDVYEWPETFVGLDALVSGTGDDRFGVLRLSLAAPAPSNPDTSDPAAPTATDAKPDPVAEAESVSERVARQMRYNRALKRPAEDALPALPPRKKAPPPPAPPGTVKYV